MNFWLLGLATENLPLWAGQACSVAGDSNTTLSTLVADPACALCFCHGIGNHVGEHVKKIGRDEPLGALDEQRHRTGGFGDTKIRRHRIERADRVLAAADRAGNAGRAGRR